MLPPLKERRKMVLQAMRERAPKLLARLKATDALDAELTSRAEAIANDYLTPEMSRDRIVARGKMDPLKQVGDAMQENRELLNQAIAQATEFPPED